MKTVTIGGRVLNVRPATVGFWRRCTEYGAKIATMTLGEVVDGAVSLIQDATSDNEGVTTAWLEAHLSFPPTKEYGEVLAASGLAAKAAPEGEQPGEAQTQ